MNIFVKDILNLLESKKLDEPVSVELLFDVSVSSNYRIAAKEKLTAENARYLLDHKIEKIDVLYDKKLLSLLIYFYPERYRVPTSSLSFVELDKIISAYKEINKKSSRQRYLISATEIHDIKNPARLLLEYNEKIDFQKWNDIKTRLDKNIKLDVFYSERGIIVLADLSSKQENYTKRFLQTTELVSLLVNPPEKVQVKICHSFVGTVDVIRVDDPSELQSVYSANNSKLVIFSENMRPEYTKALAQLKEWDKFVRLLMIKNINPGEKEQNLQVIKRSYQTDHWDINDY
ncbi:MAG: hypothetical protein OEZ36_13990 [Spirochaetota bacterium]|nr:hypothetical protein [Spirochaetota bacterium]